MNSSAISTCFPLEEVLEPPLGNLSIPLFLFLPFFFLVLASSRFNTATLFLSLFSSDWLLGFFLAALEGAPPLLLLLLLFLEIIRTQQIKSRVYVFETSSGVRLSAMENWLIRLIFHGEGIMAPPQRHYSRP